MWKLQLTVKSYLRNFSFRYIIVEVQGVESLEDEYLPIEVVGEDGFWSAIQACLVKSEFPVRDVGPCHVGNRKVESINRRMTRSLHDTSGKFLSTHVGRTILMADIEIKITLDQKVLSK